MGAAGGVDGQQWYAPLIPVFETRGEPNDHTLPEMACKSLSLCAELEEDQNRGIPHAVTQSLQSSKFCSGVVKPSRVTATIVDEARASLSEL